MWRRVALFLETPLYVSGGNRVVPFAVGYVISRASRGVAGVGVSPPKSGAARFDLAHAKARKRPPRNLDRNIRVDCPMGNGTTRKAAEANRGGTG